MRRLLLAVLCLLPVACGTDRGPGVVAVADGSSTTVTAYSGDDPPPVTVRAGDAELELRPWTYCYGNLCADGMPPDELPSLGSPAEAVVSFPLAGWEFQATFGVTASGCGRRDTVELERLSPTTFRLVPVGAAGEQVVTLFGRGNGDVIVSFRWDTPVDGAYVAPTATASVVADHDGVPDSYGVEIGATGLAASPTEASASITVTSASGASATLEPPRQPSGCDDGTVAFRAPAEVGEVAAELGDPPFTYDVVLVLDGAEHRAQATWPDDVDPECSPCVPLRFDPPLPGPAGTLGGPQR